MKTLGASIVQRGIASVGDVEEALARQVMYGGDLATNLLELASVSETELTELLAISHNLQPAPRGELPVSADGVRRLVPGDLAFRHGLYPLSEANGTLTVAVAEPLAKEVEQDLSFALGVTIKQLAAPLVRIRQAVARDYQQPLDKRTARIIAKLTGSPASLSEPPRIDFSGLPRHETLPPSAYANDKYVDMEAPTGPPPEVYPITGPSTQRAFVVSSHLAENQKDSQPGSANASTAAPDERPASTTKRNTTDPVFAPSNPSGTTAPAAEMPASNPPSAPVPPAPDRQKSVLPRANVLGQAARALAGQSRANENKPHRRLGPYTAADAERDLMGADDRDDVLNAFFDFAAQYFEYCALFVMHGDLAEGRDARGPGAGPEAVRALGIPLDLPSAIASVHERGKWQLVRLTGGGIDVGLAKDLKRESGPLCLLLPIIMRKRCVLILYGDHGTDDVRLSDIGDVISFAPLVASGLERVILKRKRAMQNDVAEAKLPLPTVPPRRSRMPLPSAEDRARALASVLDDSASNNTASKQDRAKPKFTTSPPAKERHVPSAAPTRPSAAPPAPQAVGPRLSSSTQSGLGPHRSERPLTLDFDSTPAAQAAVEASPVSESDDSEEGDRASVIPQRVLSIEPPAPASDGELSRTQMSPRGADEPGGASSPGGASVMAPPSEPPEDGWDVESERPRGKGSPLAVAPESPTAPAIDIGTAELDHELMDAIARDERAPLAPASRSLAFSARPPSRRQTSEELRLPSVIVDFESDCRALVHRLCAGDPEASDKLAELGATAVSALVAEFPGPITQQLSRGSGDSVQRASDCGPVMRTLARIGSPSIPFLVVRTADAQPLVREWATRLLGELPNRESAVAVARRLVDDHAEVRRAALAAARMHQKHTLARAAIREHLADIARDSTRNNEARHAAVEALSDIRDAESVPALIQLLGDPNRELVKSAHWGLAVLTRTDLGNASDAWEKWWHKNAGRHRIEWLIDSLMHEDAEIRRAAGDELKSITKEYFGYYDDLPRRERAAAQARYREWWEGKGRARFSLN